MDIFNHFYIKQSTIYIK